MEPFTEPRLLPCLHTLCQICLDGVIAGSPYFNCPLCRTEISTPDGGANGFPENKFITCYYVKEQGAKCKTSVRPDISTLNSKKSNIRPILCASSDDGEDHGQVDRFCTECAEYYCTNCSKIHRRQKATRSHHQVPHDEVTEEMVRVASLESQSPTCPKHRGEKLSKLYCDTCNIPVCPLCSHAQHTHHNIREVSVVDRECKHQLKEVVGKINEYMAVIKTQNGRLSESRRFAKSCAQEAKLMVDTAVREYCEILQRRGRRVTEEIEKQYHERDSGPAAEEKANNLDIAQLESLLSFVEHLQTRDSSLNRIASLSEVRTRTLAMEVTCTNIQHKSPFKRPTVDEMIRESLHMMTLSEMKEMSSNDAVGGISLRLEVMVDIPPMETRTVSRLTV